MDNGIQPQFWLDLTQAAEWLQDLTSTRVDTPDLLQLCELGKCAAYIRPDVGAISPLTGLSSISDKYLVQSWNQRQVSSYQSIVTPNGFQQVSNAAEFVKSGTHVTSVLKMIGYVTVGYYSAAKRFDDDPVLICDEGHAHWSALVDMRNCFPLFKPMDILALSQKLNGVEENLDANDTELRELRQQLEIERSKREVAEARVAELILQIENSQQYNLSESATNGLTFPYATKHLEVMRDAAIKHWAGHDRSKPAPYGIQKAVQAFLATRTGENPRKLAELAVAIKPDGLPKT
jgi:hypothetical protein